MAITITGIEYTHLIEYDDAYNPVYEGWALPPAGTALAVWKIKKISWDGNTGTANPISEKWANGKRDFTLVWNSRDSYTYS